MQNLNIQVSKLDVLTELRLYVGASIPQDKAKGLTYPSADLKQRIKTQVKSLALIHYDLIQ